MKDTILYYTIMIPGVALTVIGAGVLFGVVLTVVGR